MSRWITLFSINAKGLFLKTVQAFGLCCSHHLLRLDLLLFQVQHKIATLLLLRASMPVPFEIFYPIVQAKLQQNVVALAGWTLLSAVISLGVLLTWSSKDLPKLPIAMGEEVPNQQERIKMFIKDNRSLLINSYNKVRQTPCI